MFVLGKYMESPAGHEATVSFGFPSTQGYVGQSATKAPPFWKGSPTPLLPIHAWGGGTNQKTPFGKIAQEIMSETAC